MFGKSGKYKKISDLVGTEIHRQVRQALEKKEQLFDNPEQAAFMAAYLKLFMFEPFSSLGVRDYGTITKYTKRVCDGVIPGRMWEIYEQGNALNDLAQDGTNKKQKKLVEVYNLGEEAGTHDGAEFFRENIQPENLYNYLIGKKVKLWD